MRGIRRGIGAGLLAAAVALGAQAATAQGLAGPYLAATQAELRNDYAAAATYYEQAMSSSGGNTALMAGAMTAHIGAGHVPRAIDLAEQLRDAGGSSQAMGLTLLADALQRTDYARAAEIARNDDYRFNPLFAQLIEGWALIGDGSFGQGADVFDAMSGNSAMEAYGALHHAFALALAGDFGSAAKLLDGDEEGPLHLNRMALLTHIVALSHADRIDEARGLTREMLIGNRSDPVLLKIEAALDAGEPVPFTQLASPAEGAAAAYAIMASALTREDAGRLGLIYARLAAYVRPDYDEMTTLAGDILVSQQRYDLAAEAYKGVAPDSPWYVTAEIGRADALADAERVDEAVEVLSSLSRAKPDNQSVLIALGDTLRREERFAPAADAYTRAIDLIGEAAPDDWRLYYVRGITYERTDRWPQAEADFRKALELNPEQPHVLNYLGYSLVELRQNLDEAQDMIERAVAQRPEDGFITDSLGWVRYRLGMYEEAVAPMERAVELEPVDPIINDHLGDVLWMVGRKTEAVFQWKRALSFDPEPEEAERIRRKLEVGLDKVLEEEAAAEGGASETTLAE